MDFFNNQIREYISSNIDLNIDFDFEKFKVDFDKPKVDFEIFKVDFGKFKVGL